jgi:hypothetical protein
MRSWSISTLQKQPSRYPLLEDAQFPEHQLSAIPTFPSPYNMFYAEPLSKKTKVTHD